MGIPLYPMRPLTEKTNEMALDCEMVRVSSTAPPYYESVLARISVVNLYEQPLMDKLVAPPAAVIDYRTAFSGIREGDLDGALDFDSVRREVAQLLRGRVLVGHGLDHDFQVLKMSHPRDLIRDTSVYYEKFYGKPPALRILAERFLGLNIQNGAHDSVQDAVVALKLYKRVRDDWERSDIRGHQSHNPNYRYRLPTNYPPL